MFREYDLARFVVQFMTHFLSVGSNKLNCIASYSSLLHYIKGLVMGSTHHFVYFLGKNVNSLESYEKRVTSRHPVTRWIF